MKHIPTETIAELRSVLESERESIIESLARMGRSDLTGDWSAVPPVLDEVEEDPNTQADRYEEFYNRGGALAHLEERLQLVKEALTRMDEGTYGLSTVSGKPIEVKRLIANPAANTTVDEMDTEPVQLMSDRGGIFDRDVDDEADEGAE